MHTWLARIPSAVKLWLATLASLVTFLQLLLNDAALVLLVSAASLVVSAFVVSLWIVWAKMPSALDSTISVARFSARERAVAGAVSAAALLAGVLLAVSAPARDTVATIVGQPVRLAHVTIGHRDSAAVVELLVFNPTEREAVITDVFLELKGVTSEASCMAFVVPVEYALADKLTIVRETSNGAQVEGLALRRPDDRTSYHYRGTLHLTGCPDRAQLFVDAVTIVPKGSHLPIALAVPDSVNAIRLPSAEQRLVPLGALIKVTPHQLRVTITVLGQSSPAIYDSGELWHEDRRTLMR